VTISTTKEILDFHEGEHIAQPCKIGNFGCDVQLLVDDLIERVAALPEPTLGLKGGVSRDAVLRLLRGES
jgi:hypothetical protein